MLFILKCLLCLENSRLTLNKRCEMFKGTNRQTFAPIAILGSRQFSSSRFDVRFGIASFGRVSFGRVSFDIVFLKYLKRGMKMLL